MNRLCGFGLLIAVAIGIWGTTGTQAAPIIVYTDRAAFVAATVSITNLTFEGLAPVGGFTSYSTPSGLTLSGVNFVGTTFEEGEGFVYRLFVINLTNPQVDYGSGAILGGPPTVFPANSGITATLPGGVTAVGSDVMASFSFPLGQTVVVTLADGTSQMFMATTFLGPQRAFIGFTSTSPILTVRFRSNQLSNGGSVEPSLDNFIFGQASPAAIPEPTAMILLGTGLAGMAVKVCRRRKL